LLVHKQALNPVKAFALSTRYNINASSSESYISQKHRLQVFHTISRLARGVRDRFRCRRPCEHVDLNQSLQTVGV
jgi:hypothetical protein